MNDGRDDRRRDAHHDGDRRARGALVATDPRRRRARRGRPRGAPGRLSGTAALHGAGPRVRRARDAAHAHARLDQRRAAAAWPGSASWRAHAARARSTRRSCSATWARDAPVDLPVVVPWSEQGGMAPMRLRRTVEVAVEDETDVEPGTPRAIAQFFRLALPLTLSGQGAFGADGRLRGDAVAQRRARARRRGRRSRASGIEQFGRAALRSISALDNGPDVPAGPREYIIFQRRVLPAWAVQLWPPCCCCRWLFAGVDGLARVRRRGSRGAAVAALDPRGRRAVPARGARRARARADRRCCPNLPGPGRPRGARRRRAGLAAVARRAGARVRAAAAVAAGSSAPVARGCVGEDPGGAAAAVALAMTVLGVGVLVVNPYTALLLVPAVHLWMLAAAPEVRVPRWVGAGARAGRAGAVRARAALLRRAARPRPARAGVGARRAARGRLRGAARGRRVEPRPGLRAARRERRGAQARGSPSGRGRTR